MVFSIVHFIGTFCNRMLMLFSCTIEHMKLMLSREDNMLKMILLQCECSVCKLLCEDIDVLLNNMILFIYLLYFFFDSTSMFLFLDDPIQLNFSPSCVFLFIKHSN